MTRVRVIRGLCGAHWGRPRLVGATLGLLCLTLALPAPVAAQSSVSATASPNPFTSGTTITIGASLQAGASPESWCYEWEGCHFWGDPFLQVNGSNGFYDVTYGWTADWADSGPGQTMQATTYTVYGGVTWYVCHGLGSCWEWEEPYSESGSTQTSVTPTVAPVPQGVSPSSGAGPAQTFTFTYTSPVGVSDIYGTAQLIHLNSGVNACMTGVLVHSGTILLYDDPATGYAGVSTVGTPVVLENSQCRVLVGNASVALSGNTATVVIPYEFKASYSGPKNNYSWASSIGGVYSSTIDAGDWTARSQVNSVQPSAASPLQTVTITGVGFGDVPGSVRFNGTTASTITSWTNTAIGVVVPLGATSGAAEVVTNGQASNGVNFTVTASPHISSVSPTWGPPGTQVTVTGANFGSSGTLKLHDEPMTTSGWTDTSVTFTVPTSATTGWVQITSGAPSNQIPFTVGTEEIAYYHTDGIGSVRMTTGHEGYVLSRHDYLPFGTEWIPAPSQDRVRFAGKEHDIETGNGSWMALDYFGARYYESANGRFTSVDPVIDIETSLANPQRWNAYTYVLNNPIRYEDPDGRSATAAGAIIGAVIGAGTAAIQGKSGREIFAAGVGGAVQGAVFGSVIDSGGATLGVLIAAGSLSGTAGRVVENAINGHSTTVEDAVISGVGGAVGAAIGGAAAVRQAARPVSRALVSGADDASLAGSGRLSTQAQKAIRSLQKRIDEHRAKLQAYIKDPDAFDNEGLLRNAPSEAIRNRIIQGRIRHLEHEIAEWERQIYELLKGGGGW